MAKTFLLERTLKNGEKKRFRAAVGGMVGEPTDEMVIDHLVKHNAYPDATDIRVISSGESSLPAGEIAKRAASGKDPIPQK